MNRLAVPILILLLLLFAGVAWALFAFLDMPPETAGPPSLETSPSVSKAEPPAAKQPGQGAETAPPASSETASFDIARIDPEGISVFAGRAEPGTNIVILGDGEPIGTAQADQNGEWTLATEHHFASKDPDLALRTATEAEMRQSKAKQAALDKSTEGQSDGGQGGRRSAKAVTSDLLKNLEGMVASARDAKETVAEPPKAEEPKAANSKIAEPKVAESKVAEPEVAESKVEEPKVEESRVEEPKVATGNATSLPATETVQESVATVRLAPQTQAEPGPSTARKTVPVPITFIFNEATFTPDGEKAAGLLLEYLQLKNYEKVTLTGHADERGTVELNMNLSRERLDTVARFLKNGGFDGELELIPKGESEPFTGVVRSEYDQEELYQLDRRVELIIER